MLIRIIWTIIHKNFEKTVIHIVINKIIKFRVKNTEWYRMISLKVN